jgi:hypothetical protein
LTNENENSNKNKNVLEQLQLESKKQSRYLKLQDGEIRILQFDRDKVEMIDNEFDGKVTKRVEYKVIDKDTNDGEKILSMAILNAKHISSLINRGRTLIEIQRVGLGKRTRYNISAV